MNVVGRESNEGQTKSLWKERWGASDRPPRRKDDIAPIDLNDRGTLAFLEQLV